MSEQETDAWWGSYSGWTMLPSVAVCVVLSGVIIWWAWTYVDPGWVRFAIILPFVLVWLVESWRWTYRFFGIHYRLTTRRLFKSWGWRRRVIDWPVASIAHVSVRRSWWEKLVGVGRLLVVNGEPGGEALVLDGVRQPFQVAEKIRTLAKKAREKTVQASVEA